MVDERGLSAFDLPRSWRHDHAAVLCAFDLIELNGEDSPFAGMRSTALRCLALSQIAARHLPIDAIAMVGDRTAA